MTVGGSGDESEAEDIDLRSVFVESTDDAGIRTLVEAQGVTRREHGTLGVELGHTGPGAETRTLVEAQGVEARGVTRRRERGMSGVKMSCGGRYPTDIQVVFLGFVALFVLTPSSATKLSVEYSTRAHLPDLFCRARRDAARISDRVYGVAQSFSASL
jgi:hypothetical protein